MHRVIERFKWDYTSTQFSCSVVSDSLQPHGWQDTRPPCPSPTPGAYSNSCPLSLWCLSTISSSVIPFSSCLQSFTALGSFPMSQSFASGGQSTGVSALVSVLPMNIQDWSLLGWTGLISLQIGRASCRERVSDFTLGGSKITAGGDCGYEIKRHLLFGIKAMTNVDRILKNQRHYFADKSPYSQSYGFPSSRVQM